jgi:GLPGLI family protein
MLFTIGSFPVLSQEKSVAKIIYQFKHLKDTTTQYVYSEDMMLLFNKKESIYSSQTKYIQDSVREKAFANAAANGGEVNLGVVRPTTPERYMVFLPDQKLITIAPFQRNDYLITEPLDNINWKILTETKKIKGYSCQKAITHYKGRDYTAWFSVELPFSFGPWKLHGLPGLILEATDKKKEVQFLCEAVIRNQTGTVTLPSNGIKTTKAAFNKMMNAYLNGAGTGSFAGNSNSDIKVDGVSLSGTRTSLKNNRTRFLGNNPIEKDN